MRVNLSQSADEAGVAKTMPKDKKTKGLFNYDAKVSFKELAPLGLQHVAAAIAGIVTPGIMVAKACKLNGSDTTLIIQTSLIMAGIATLIQLFPIFRRFGSRLPMMMGASFATVPILLIIGGSYGIGSIFGAQLIGGLVVLTMGFFLKYIRILFPPIVTGTVILSIGLSLFPVAVKYMAGGAGSATFGSVQNWSVAIVTFIVVFTLNYFGKGLFKLASILIGMIVGYILALTMGMVNFGPVQSASFMQVIPPMHFGIRFDLIPILLLTIIFLVDAVQSIGQFTATTMGAMDRQPTDRELSGAIMGKGLINTLGSFFGGLAVGTFGQNVGLVIETKVINKYILTFSSIFLVVAGFVPKVASILTTIPYAVIGGATISVFATIAMTGIRTIVSAGLSSLNVGIVGLSLAAGVGVALSPNCLAGFPTWVNTVFGTSEVILTTILAVILNLVLNIIKKPEKAQATKG
jgi:NCS2 family nucleobase:cation symporter-2